MCHWYDNFKGFWGKFANVGVLECRPDVEHRALKKLVNLIFFEEGRVVLNKFRELRNCRNTCEPVNLKLRNSARSHLRKEVRPHILRQFYWSNYSEAESRVFNLLRVVGAHLLEQTLLHLFTDACINSKPNVTLAFLIRGVFDCVLENDWGYEFTRRGVRFVCQCPNQRHQEFGLPKVSEKNHLPHSHFCSGGSVPRRSVVGFDLHFSDKLKCLPGLLTHSRN